MVENFKKIAAEAALGELRPGMRLGLGTGSTARHFVDLLGDRVAAGFQCRCVPTSEATAAQARARAIPLATLDELPELDLTVDGADEVGPGLALIKGGGAALLREKIVAAASRRLVVIADAGKHVAVLGRFPLPVEVNPFGLGATLRLVDAVARRHGATIEPRLRRDAAGAPVVTDGGHFLVDVAMGAIADPAALSDALHRVPGVVEHGLFLGLCARAYLAGDGGVTVLDA